MDKSIIDTINLEELDKTGSKETGTDKSSDILLFDVRRKSDYLAEPVLISGAQWHDPEEIENWSKTIPENKEVVIYCVKGGSVSKSVSDYLNKRQIKTSYLEGGLKAWKDSGGTTRDAN
ncbi:MAG: sulfurtransferase [Desulfamplus sp.]|nr:sulfurtransferase [Desulfamplus sp.]